MRVIAGSAKRLPLRCPQGNDIRPTTDRIKETLFNILQMDIAGCRFLDLYAGSGAIGIEALSRGAREAVFVDNFKEAVSCIKYNLDFTHLAQRAIVMHTDVISAINRLKQKGVFDIVFMDPPYAHNVEREVLEILGISGLVDEESVIIIEETLNVELSYIDTCGFEVYRVKQYKTNQHLFLKWRGATIK